MILINFTIIHNGDSVGGILGSPKNLEITVCENGGSSTKPPPTKPPTNQSHPKFGDFQQRQGMVSAPPPQPTVVKQEIQKTPPKSFYGAQSNMRQYGAMPPSSTSLSSSPMSTRSVFPITSLNPYQNKSVTCITYMYINLTFTYMYCRWTIKARVTNKPSVRTYTNSKGEGRVMSIDLLDQSVSFPRPLPLTDPLYVFMITAHVHIHVHLRLLSILGWD